MNYVKNFALSENLKGNITMLSLLFLNMRACKSNVENMLKPNIVYHECYKSIVSLAHYFYREMGEM
jgi:hypothetical protein